MNSQWIVKPTPNAMIASTARSTKSSTDHTPFSVSPFRVATAFVQSRIRLAGRRPENALSFPGQATRANRTGGRPGEDLAQLRGEPGCASRPPPPGAARARRDRQHGSDEGGRSPVPPDPRGAGDDVREARTAAVVAAGPPAG